MRDQRCGSCDIYATSAADHAISTRPALRITRYLRDQRCRSRAIYVTSAADPVMFARPALEIMRYLRDQRCNSGGVYATSAVAARCLRNPRCSYGDIYATNTTALAMFCPSTVQKRTQISNCAFEGCCSQLYLGSQTEETVLYRSFDRSLLSAKVASCRSKTVKQEYGGVGE